VFLASVTCSVSCCPDGQLRACSSIALPWLSILRMVGLIASTSDDVQESFVHVLEPRWNCPIAGTLGSSPVFVRLLWPSCHPWRWWNAFASSGPPRQSRLDVESRRILRKREASGYRQSVCGLFVPQVADLFEGRFAGESR